MAGDNLRHSSRGKDSPEFLVLTLQNRYQATPICDHFSLAESRKHAYVVAGNILR